MVLISYFYSSILHSHIITSSPTVGEGVGVGDEVVVGVGVRVG